MNTEWELQAADLDLKMDVIRRQMGLIKDEHKRQWLALAMEHHALAGRRAQILEGAAREVEAEASGQAE